MTNSACSDLGGRGLQPPYCPRTPFEVKEEEENRGKRRRK